MNARVIIVIKSICCAKTKDAPREIDDAACDGSRPTTVSERELGSSVDESVDAPG
jgi:hypothetical protein